MLPLRSLPACPAVSAEPLEIVVQGPLPWRPFAEALAIPSHEHWTALPGEPFDDFRVRVRLAAMDALYLVFHPERGEP